MEFQVGDKVEWCGIVGKIVRLSTVNMDNYPLYAEFGIGVEGEWFTSDGRLHSWHKEPSLKLLKRKSKTVTRYKYAWRIERNKYWQESAWYYENIDEARKCLGTDKVKRLDYTATEFEVE